MTYLWIFVTLFIFKIAIVSYIRIQLTQHGHLKMYHVVKKEFIYLIIYKVRLG